MFESGIPRVECSRVVCWAVHSEVVCSGWYTREWYVWECGSDTLMIRNGMMERGTLGWEWGSDRLRGGMLVSGTLGSGTLGGA